MYSPKIRAPRRVQDEKIRHFWRKENNLVHIWVYYDLLVVIGRDEVVLMWLFSQSLSGEAIEWFISHKIRHCPSYNALSKESIIRLA